MAIAYHHTSPTIYLFILNKRFQLQYGHFVAVHNFKWNEHLLMHKHSRLCWYISWHLIKLNIPGWITPLVFNQYNLQFLIGLSAALTVVRTHVPLPAKKKLAGRHPSTKEALGKHIPHPLLLYQRDTWFVWHSFWGLNTIKYLHNFWAKFSWKQFAANQISAGSSQRLSDGIVDACKFLKSCQKRRSQLGMQQNVFGVIQFLFFFLLWCKNQIFLYFLANKVCFQVC